MLIRRFKRPGFKLVAQAGRGMLVETYRCYIGIMEKKMHATIVYWYFIGLVGNEGLYAIWGVYGDDIPLFPTQPQ